MNLLEVRKTLEEDLTSLMSKRSVAINNNHEKGAIEYTRLIKDTIDLLNKLPEQSEEWLTMTSCYGMIRPEFDNLPYEEMIPNEHFVSVISVWEQNISGKIRNHKIYERGNQIK